MFVSRDLFPSTYKKLKDSYWTVRLQTQAYTFITDARAAQKELAGITETESHQNWDKWGYGLPDHFPELDSLGSPHWLWKQQVQGVATADSLLLCNHLHPSAIWSDLDVHDVLQWQNRSWREKASINHVSYLSALLHTSVTSTKGILIHPNTRFHRGCCREAGKGRKMLLLFHWFLPGKNTNTTMQAVLLFHFEISVPSAASN